MTAGLIVILVMLLVYLGFMVKAVMDAPYYDEETKTFVFGKKEKKDKGKDEGNV